jgi:hypothetical protein
VCASLFTDYRPGDLVLVAEPDGTTFAGPVQRVGAPWGMMVGSSYGRSIPVSFRYATMLEPNEAEHPIRERTARA